jgi:UDP:flavonoid glycosyltransferase YjiC (YdhE family)
MPVLCEKLLANFLNNFFRYAGAKTSRVLKRFGLQEIDDIRFTLKGNRTFLWDFPEFMPIQTSPNTVHVGPINLHHWPYDMANIEKALDTQYPIAVVSFGTCVTDRGVVLRIVRLLVELGFHVIVAAGGQSPMFNIELAHPQVTVVNFAPLNELFPYASLLVTHGGQMTIFEALQNKVPVCVMPFQPEQAHNGVCLERIGCGCRLIPPTFFTGLVDDYISSFIRLTDQAIKMKIDSLIGSAKTKESLSKTKSIIERYHGADSIVEFLEVI